MAWYDRRSGAANQHDFYAQRINGNGVVKWTLDGVLVCTAGAYQRYAAIEPDQAGGAIIVWSGQGALFAQRLNGAGAPLWGTNGKQLTFGPGNEFNPCMQALPDGSVIIAWVDSRPNGPGIYALRINGTGTILWGGFGGVAVCTTGSPDYPVITTGNVVTVVWEDHRNGGGDLYAQQINASGSVVWAANGVPLCTGTGDQRAPQLASDYAGGVLATWSERRYVYSNIFAPSDIYVQRVDQTGTALWGAQGMTLCNATDDQDTPSIVSDPTGATIVWHDNRTLHDIYAQRVNLAGVPQWTANGVAVSAATMYQTSPVSVSDMSGGVIVAWDDYRGSSRNIYAQRIDSYGNTLWPEGIVLSASDLTQILPVITSDGHGGAVVGWLRESNGQDDLYAARVTGDGSLPTAAGDTPSFTGLVVRDQFPNPFTTSTTLDVFLPSSSEVTIDVYDVAGRRMRHQSFGMMRAGWQQAVMDANADSGRQLPSGVYFYKVRGAGETVTKKMVIAR